MRVLVHRKDSHPVGGGVGQPHVPIDAANGVGKRTSAGYHEDAAAARGRRDHGEDLVETMCLREDPATNLDDEIDPPGRADRASGHPRIAMRRSRITVRLSARRSITVTQQGHGGGWRESRGRGAKLARKGYDLQTSKPGRGVPEECAEAGDDGRVERLTPRHSAEGEQPGLGRQHHDI